MATLQPRIQAPRTVIRGEIFEVRSLINHPMETGLRHDGTGNVIARNLINRFECRYDGVVVFSADLHEAVAANPYLSFHVRAAQSGHLQFAWRQDDGAVFTLQQSLTVGG